MLHLYSYYSGWSSTVFIDLGYPVHYPAPSATKLSLGIELESCHKYFPEEREGYGSRLFTHCLDNNFSIPGSNVKLEEHYLLPRSEHEPLLSRRSASNPGSYSIVVSAGVDPGELECDTVLDRSALNNGFAPTGDVQNLAFPSIVSTLKTWDSTVMISITCQARN